MTDYKVEITEGGFAITINNVLVIHVDYEGNLEFQPAPNVNDFLSGLENLTII